MISIDYNSEKTVTHFHKSNAFVRGIRGPIGSGKSVGCCWEIWLKSSNQKPHNGTRSSKWAIVRNTYGELRSTTISTWLD